MQRYATTVIAQETMKLGQNESPSRSRNGSAPKSASDGNTSQKMLVESAATLCALPVSRYSQMKASYEVRGSEARMAPQMELRFPSSDTATTTTAVMTTLIAYCHIEFHHLRHAAFDSD